MSWKIHTGRRMAGDLDRVYRRLLVAKPLAQALCAKMTLQWLAAAVLGWRAHEEEAKGPFFNPYSWAWGTLTDRQLPQDAAPSKTLAILVCEQPAFLQFFDREDLVGGVEDFAFWTNTDRPAGVSRAEWNQRGEIWKASLGPTGRPAQRGLRFQLACTSLVEVPSKEQIDAMVEEHRNSGLLDRMTKARGRG